MSDDDKKSLGKSNFSVGYGKPPKHSQFQDGKSGNPGGKNNKTFNSLEANFWRVSSKQVAVNTAGKPQKVSLLEAFVINLHHHALKSSPHAKLLTDYDLASPEVPPPEHGRIIKTEHGAYQTLVITDDEMRQMERLRDELKKYLFGADPDAEDPK